MAENGTRIEQLVCIYHLMIVRWVCAYKSIGALMFLHIVLCNQNRLDFRLRQCTQVATGSSLCYSTDSTRLPTPARIEKPRLPNGSSRINRSFRRTIQSHFKNFTEQSNKSNRLRMKSFFFFRVSCCINNQCSLHMN